PLVDLGLFRNRIFDAIVVGGSLSNVVYCLVAVFSALYLQQSRGFSPFQSGLIFLALSAGSGSASYFSGKLAERHPSARLMAIGMAQGDGAADQRGWHGGADGRGGALALPAALSRDRGRTRSRLGAGERRHSDGREAI